MACSIIMYPSPPSSQIIPSSLCKLICLTVRHSHNNIFRWWSQVRSALALSTGDLRYFIRPHTKNQIDINVYGEFNR